MIKLFVKKLTSIANNAPIANQNTKKPTVIISRTRNSPDIINQTYHINVPPINNIIIL